MLEATIRADVRAPWASVEQQVAWIQWLVSALAQKRSGEEQRLFIKFDSRSIFDFPLIRLAFPDVPWIFVYRDPVEVIVSNLRRPSTLVTRGMSDVTVPGLEIAEIAGMEDDEYAARVLGVIAETGAHHAAVAGGMLIHYPQLPEAVWGGLQRHFGLHFTVEEIEEMKRASAFNAKQPGQPFRSDVDSKQREADRRIRALADRWLRPHYARLEELRRMQSSGGWLDG